MVPEFDTFGIVLGTAIGGSVGCGAAMAKADDVDADADDVANGALVTVDGDTLYIVDNVKSQGMFILGLLLYL